MPPRAGCGSDNQDAQAGSVGTGAEKVTLRLGYFPNNAPLLMAHMIAVFVIGIVIDSLLFATLERSIRRRWGLGRA